MTTAVDIAKDVIKILDSPNSFEVERGKYVETYGDIYLKVGHDNSIKDVLDELMPNCKVCALGSMLLAHIDLENKITFGDLDAYINNFDVCLDVLRTNCSKPLSAYFSNVQLFLIETAFECSANCSLIEYNGDTYEFKRNGDLYYKNDQYDESYIYELTPLIKAALVFGYQYESNRERLRAIMTNIVENNGEFKP